MPEVQEKLADRPDDAARYWIGEGFKPGGVVRAVDQTTAPKGVHPLFDGIKIVDTDTHVTEAPDLWSSRAPQRLRAKMPRIERVDGVDRWFVEDRNFGMTGGASLAQTATSCWDA